jgi:hypothetical protein
MIGNIKKHSRALALLPLVLSLAFCNSPDKAGKGPASDYKADINWDKVKTSIRL